MTKYEKLLDEYPEVIVEEKSMINDGLFCDGYVWIRNNQSQAQKACILAEEIGHYLTSAGDIIDLRVLENTKQEYKARKWAYEKIIPIQNIYKAAINGITQLHEMAEYLDVDEVFLFNCLKYYGFIDM